MQALERPAPWTLVVVAAILQGGLAGNLCVAGVFPDFLLTTVLCLALLLGAEVGLATGFVGGFLYAVLEGASPGGFLVSRAAAGLLLGFLGTRLMPRGVRMPLGLVVLGTVLAETVFFLFNPAVGAAQLLRVTVGKALWAAALASVLYPLCTRLVRR